MIQVLGTTWHQMPPPASAGAMTISSQEVVSGVHQNSPETPLAIEIALCPAESLFTVVTNVHPAGGGAGGAHEVGGGGDGGVG